MVWCSAGPGHEHRQCHMGPGLHQARVCYQDSFSTWWLLLIVEHSLVHLLFVVYIVFRLCYTLTTLIQVKSECQSQLITGLFRTVFTMHVPG